MAKTQQLKRKLIGDVVSDSMVQTRVVKVSRVISHPVYHKKITRSEKFKANDIKNEYKVGDRVVIEECRPISRDKRWRIIGKAE